MLKAGSRRNLICNGRLGRPSPCFPFRTIGGAKDDGYLGEGITEDIITGLSSSRSLYVVAAIRPFGIATEKKIFVRPPLSLTCDTCSTGASGGKEPVCGLTRS